MKNNLTIIIAYLIRTLIMVGIIIFFPGFLQSAGMDGLFTSLKSLVLFSLIAMAVNLILANAQRKDDAQVIKIFIIFVTDFIIMTSLYTGALIFEAIRSNVGSGLIILVAPIISGMYVLPQAIVLAIVTKLTETLG